MVSTKLNYTNNEDKTGEKRENPSLLQATGELKVTVGVGSVSIQKDLMKLVENKCLHMAVYTEKGPCPDESCQLDYKLQINLIDSPPDNAYRVIEQPGFCISFDEAVYKSIDRGRENIVIRRGILGRLYAKGFSVTQ